MRKNILRKASTSPKDSIDRFPVSKYKLKKTLTVGISASLHDLGEALLRHIIEVYSGLNRIEVLILCLRDLCHFIFLIYLNLSHCDKSNKRDSTTCID